MSRLRRVAEFAAAYASGRLTPREVIERFLAAHATTEKRDPPLRAFIAVDPARLREEADEATRRLRAGGSRSPLDGVPVAVKDAYDVAGYRTTGGTRVLGDAPAARDAPAVTRLREAGALIAGKANLHELCAGPSGINIHHGVARNPWDPARDTGGSSSGSAAAVASGLTPLALGTDTAGSIRIPSSLCGVVGLKGTYGRVSTDGIVPLSWSMDHAGPIASGVDDVRLAFGILAGAPVAKEPMPGRPRIGICEAWWRDADPAVAGVARAAIDLIGTPVSIELAHIGLSRTAGSVILLVEAASANRALLEEGAPLQPSVRAQLEAGFGFRASELLKAQQVRTLVSQDFARAFADVDLIATPSTAITAPLYRADAFSDGETDQATIDRLIAFTTAPNLAGLPAISVPCGHIGGLPVGLQLFGPPRSESRVLAAADLVEQCVENPSPPGWLDLLA